MRETLSESVCPHCLGAIAAAAPDDDGGRQCPHCGGTLAGVDAQAAGTAGPVSGTGHTHRERMVADLRQAFAFEVDALASPDTCWLTDGLNASAHRDVQDASALAVGSRLGDFVILGELGRGGMGIVYRARQVSLDREVALKVLPAFTHRGGMAVQRFKAEAQAAARLHHTNIVSIYAQGEHAGQLYYAMELVDGVGLDEVVRGQRDRVGGADARRGSSIGWTLGGQAVPSQKRPTGPAPDGRRTPRAATPPRWTAQDYRRLATLLAEAADALDYAHSHGVIHRDIKPHNLLLSRDERLHVTDFGLARLTDEPHLTVSGEIMGTPAYLSPEQVRGEVAAIDHRTDIYSLGVTMYELLTGRKPFDGRTRDSIINAICVTEPTPPRRLDPLIPVELEVICLRAVERDAARRHPSAALLAEDLRRFAEGRPILSRRPSLIKRGAKWMRNHKVLAATLPSALVVMVLVAGLCWTSWMARAARQREADQWVQKAYGRLAYINYRQPGGAAAELARGVALGAAPIPVELTRALVCLGARDQVGAIAHLDTVLEHEPGDLRGLYLKAWAQYRESDEGAAQETLEYAESLGPPVTPDAWFFRGLAMHFTDPDQAVESYRQANALRARENAFYAQAMLHMARARNQQIYATRSLEPFSEARAALEQLIEHGLYDAYPHYLLSITHRLAAEIYSGSAGTRDNSLVDQHYEQALHWARVGQEVAPADFHPILAEAECLESMGRYAEAVDAHSRTLEVSSNDVPRCECYHYRWRLHYWLGELDAALADAAAHAECMPESRAYAHVYPALILAERGDRPAALGHARALADEEPTNAMAVLWSATTLRLLGEPDEASQLLADREDAVDFAADLEPEQTETWLRQLYATCRTGDDLDRLETLARESDRPWRLWGEAYFHIAARRLADDDRAGAEAAFERAYRAFDSETRYTYHAKLILKKIQADPTWPDWIPNVAHTPTNNVAPDRVIGMRSERTGKR